MSNLVFPSSLPGFQIGIKREPVYDVITSEASSGKEIRSSLAFSPRYKYVVGFALLRNSASLREAQTLWNFFARHFGGLDSFLLTDPDDNAVSSHGFGVGDGVTTTFQLQRQLAGSINDNTGGPWPSVSTPRTSLCLQSANFPNASWTKTSLGAPLAVPSPDGTAGGSSYTSSAGGATLTQTVAGLVATATYTLSVWAYCTAGTTIRIGTTEGSAAAVTLLASGGWQRLTWTFTAAGTSTVVTLGASASWGNTVAISWWGAQLEAGSSATSYVATTTAAITASPVYYPGFTDGFEPVTDLNFQQPFSVSVAGVAKVFGTDYTAPANGLTTFTAAPASGAALTWSGSYYRRVRFADSGLAATRFDWFRYEAKTINLLSVK